MKKVTVKPARKELKVPFPGGTGFVPAAGVKVKMNSYFARRIKEGDLVVAGSRKTETDEKGIDK